MLPGGLFPDEMMWLLHLQCGSEGQRKPPCTQWPHGRRWRHAGPPLRHEDIPRTCSIKNTLVTQVTRTKQEAPVTCECEVERGWELSGVCEGNNDGGGGANQGRDAQSLLRLWMKTTSSQNHTPVLKLKAETDSFTGRERKNKGREKRRR